MALYLALDSGSPLVSVAVGEPGRPFATREREIRGSSEALPALIDEVLEEVGIAVSELAGIVALQGPGSFTGLRVGLATTVGLHLATGIAATAIPTLDLLALQAFRSGATGTVVAAVDALRGEWSWAAFEDGPIPRTTVVPSVGDREAIASVSPGVVIGFGVPASLSGSAPKLVEPGPLAVEALFRLDRAPLDWNPTLLYRPIYSRPPAARALAVP